MKTTKLIAVCMLISALDAQLGGILAQGTAFSWKRWLKRTLASGHYRKGIIMNTKRSNGAARPLALLDFLLVCIPCAFRVALAALAAGAVTTGALAAGTLTFTNPTPVVADYFGHSVAGVGTDRVLIGAPTDDAGAGDAGAAYLFSIETSCERPPAGLVAWWRAQNNAADSAGTNHGILLNGAGFTTGQVGQAFGFDGVDDRVTIPGLLGKLPTNEITVEFWQKVNDATTQGTFTGWTYSPGGHFSAIVPDLFGRVIWLFGEGCSVGCLAYFPSVSIVGSWQHFALVASQSGNSMRIYRNGVKEAEKTGMTPFVRTSH